MDVEDFAKFYYKTDEPTKAQTNTVRTMCREGKFKCAERIGRRWVIDCTVEWPLMFPDEERRPEPKPAAERKPLVTADMTLGEALAALLDALAVREAANVQ